jgi:putative membrane protein
MKTLLSISFAAFLAGSLPAAFAQDKLAKQELDTLQKLAQGDMAEVETGKLAQDKAASADVKKFGARMVQDHGKMLEEKQQLAQTKGVKLPDNPGKKHEAEAKKLQAVSGAAFDRQYMSAMVKDHEEDLKVVQKTAKDAKDPDLKAAAQKAEPIITDHLQMAKQINSSLGKGEGKK